MPFRVLFRLHILPFSALTPQSNKALPAAFEILQCARSEMPRKWLAPLLRCPKLCGIHNDRRFFLQFP
jgi:hypothetical protein